MLAAATLLPNAQNEQSINIGMNATKVTATVTGNVSYERMSFGRATSSYQHCQSIAPGKSTNESGYLVRLYSNTGALIASAKFKSFTPGFLNLKEISVSGTHQMLLDLE